MSEKFKCSRLCLPSRTKLCKRLHHFSVMYFFIYFWPIFFFILLRVYMKRLRYFAGVPKQLANGWRARLDLKIVTAQLLHWFVLLRPFSWSHVVQKALTRNSEWVDGYHRLSNLISYCPKLTQRRFEDLRHHRDHYIQWYCLAHCK